MPNLVATPLDHETIQHGSTKAAFPVYNDLLGEEYDTIEALDQKEARWNQKLLLLADKIAHEKGLKPWEVASILNNLEVASMEEKLSFLGVRLVELTELLACRPSEAQRTLEIATAAIRCRLDSNFTMAQAKTLTKRFLQQVCDFIYREQLGNAYTPYSELLAQKNMLQEQVDSLTKVFDVALETTKKGNKGGLDALHKALMDFGTAQEQLGKEEKSDLETD